MSDDLSKIPYVLELSKRTVNNIRQNIALSLAVIAFLVPMALGGWIGLVPWLLINEVGGLLLTINGLRLLRQLPIKKSPVRKADRAWGGLVIA